MKTLSITYRSGEVSVIHEEIHLGDEIEIVVNGWKQTPLIMTLESNLTEYLKIIGFRETETGLLANVYLYSDELKKAFRHIHKNGNRIFRVKASCNGTVVFEFELRILNLSSVASDSVISIVDSAIKQHMATAFHMYADGELARHITISDTGYWMVDGVNTGTPARGEKGEKGDTGANGVSVTHSWSGTTLTVTSASGTSSANLKGEKGEKGDTGATGASNTLTIGS
ncbi:MAG: hypothetical protein EOM54_10945, partial [Clostridia bacterium]|nr:hypothetical protein [Clostridia bacterium]